MFYSHINKKDSFDNVVVNEAYFGRTPGVKKIEDIFRQIKQKYDGQFFTTELDTDPLRYKLNKTVEDVFGFAVCDVQFLPTTDVNMCTYPVGFDLTASLDFDNTTVVEKSNGYRFKKEAGYSTIICVFNGLALDPNVTVQEVTAVFLHEVGHNFTHVAVNGVGYFQFAYNILATVASFGAYYLLFSNASKRAQISFSDWLREQQVLNTIANGITVCWSLWCHIVKEAITYLNYKALILNPFASVGIIVRHMKNKFIPNPNSPLSLLNFLIVPRQLAVGYSDEQFADSFAAMYGYGPELASCFEKMYSNHETNNTVVRGIVSRTFPWLNAYIDLVTLPAVIAITAVDEHPEFAARMSNNLRQLETDLKDKRYSPKMKARLRSDIEKCKEQLNKLKENSISFEKDKLKGQAVYMQYQSFMLNLIDGGDIKHHLFTFSKPENVNITFDKLLNKVAKSKNKK